MKKILLSILIGFSVTALFAQSLQIIDEAGNDITGSTVNASGDASGTLTEHAYVVNTSGTSLTVKVKRIVNNDIPGTDNYFCWTQCYGPPVNVSPQSESIAPADTNKKFGAYVNANGNTGTGNITYVFYDINNPTDSSFFTVNFMIFPLGISEINKGKVSAAYPNPASENITFKYELTNKSATAKIIIYNALGARLKEVELNNFEGKADITVSDLPQGIYFYSLLSDGKTVATKKFTVVH